MIGIVITIVTIVFTVVPTAVVRIQISIQGVCISVIVIIVNSFLLRRTKVIHIIPLIVITILTDINTFIIVIISISTFGMTLIIRFIGFLFIFLFLFFTDVEIMVFRQITRYLPSIMIGPSPIVISFSGIHFSIPRIRQHRNNTVGHIFIDKITILHDDTIQQRIQLHSVIVCFQYFIGIRNIIDCKFSKVNCIMDSSDIRFIHRDLSIILAHDYSLTIFIVDPRGELIDTCSQSIFREVFSYRFTIFIEVIQIIK